MVRWRVFIQLLLLIIAASLAAVSRAESPVVAADKHSPVGYWQTFDAKSAKAKSIVKIFIVHEQFYGRVMQINYQPGHGPSDILSCTDKPQRILGMVILSGMTPDTTEKNHWLDGQIFDPKTCNVYSAQMTLTDNDQALAVLIYKGSTLLGHTQTWRRLPVTALSAFPKAMVATGSDKVAVLA